MGATEIAFVGQTNANGEGHMSSSCRASKASSRSRLRGSVAPGHLRPYTPRTPPQESPAEPGMPAYPNPLPQSLRAIEPLQRPVNRDDPSASPNDHTREN